MAELTTFCFISSDSMPFQMENVHWTEFRSIKIIFVEIVWLICSTLSNKCNILKVKPSFLVRNPHFLLFFFHSFQEKMDYRNVSISKYFIRWTLFLENSTNDACWNADLCAFRILHKIMLLQSQIPTLCIYIQCLQIRALVCQTWGGYSKVSFLDLLEHSSWYNLM